jgi:hypothetical protein
MGRAPLPSILLGLWLGSSALGAQTPAPSPVLVELFTSEGCSSCPPADEFLRQLDAQQPIRGAHLIVLSEHVDYWDGQGWKDPYSSREITARQSDYERVLKVREAFTPQFIVDGTSDMRLSQRAKIAPLLMAAASSPKVTMSIDSLRVEPGSPRRVKGTISVDGTTVQRSSEIYVALALDHADSSVLRGENRGQRLSHVAVLRELVKLGAIDPGVFTHRDFDITLRADEPVEELRVVSFLQDPGLSSVRGAAESRTSISN